jgi:hypothetical protein
MAASPVSLNPPSYEGGRGEATLGGTLESSNLGECGMTVEFRCWHTGEMLAESQEAGTDAKPKDTLRVNMEDGRVRIMIVHSRTTHVTETPERTVLRVTEIEVVGGIDDEMA